MRKLFVGPDRPSGRGRNSDLREHFIRAERGGHDILKEVLNLDCPLALWADRLQLSAKNQHHCRVVSGRISVDQASTNRPHVPHLRISDDGGGLRKGWAFFVGGGLTFRLSSAWWPRR